jgi:hypothetical protein
VRSQPANKVEDIGVAPHPGGETAESGQRFHAVGIRALALDVAVHAICIRPVRFDRDSGKTLFENQPFCDPDAFAVKLVCAMRRFSQENKPRIADEGEQVVVVGSSMSQWMCGVTN